jgi:hypothetical protein
VYENGTICGLLKLFQEDGIRRNKENDGGVNLRYIVSTFVKSQYTPYTKIIC